MRRTAKPAPPEAARWSRTLLQACREAWLVDTTKAASERAAITSARDALAVAGALIALAGGKDASLRAYRTLSGLLLRQGRSRDWREALRHVPATGDGVRALTGTYMAYEDAARRGHFESFTTAAGVRLRDVVPGMVQVSHAGPAYVEVSREKWFRHPNRVFSEDAIRDASSRLRGALGSSHPEGDRRAHADQIREKFGG